MRIGKEKGTERVSRRVSTHTEGAAGGERRVRTKLGVREEGRSGAQRAESQKGPRRSCREGDGEHMTAAAGSRVECPLQRTEQLGRVRGSDLHPLSLLT